jgi:hypothetical protein
MFEWIVVSFLPTRKSKRGKVLQDNTCNQHGPGLGSDSVRKNKVGKMGEHAKPKVLLLVSSP